MSRFYEFSELGQLKYISLELTNACNYKCSVCWSQNPHLYPSRAKGFMSDELFQKLLSELKPDAKKYVVALSYAGEATLHPKFKQYSQQGHDAGFEKFQLATNGSTLTPDIRETILNCYTEVAVSIHNTPNIDKVLTDYKLLSEENTINENTVRLDLRLNIVQQEFSPGEHYLLMQKIRKAHHKFKLISALTEDLVGVCDKTVVYPLCPSMYTYLAVLWNGDTLPCCHLLSSGSWSLGNVNTQTMHDVFFGAAYEALRNGKQEGTPCLKCCLRR
jgi:Iron-sulfur cluster-binding domain